MAKRAQQRKQFMSKVHRKVKKPAKKIDASCPLAAIRSVSGNGASKPSRNFFAMAAPLQLQDFQALKYQLVFCVPPEKASLLLPRFDVLAQNLESQNLESQSFESQSLESQTLELFEFFDFDVRGRSQKGRGGGVPPRGFH